MPAILVVLCVVLAQAVPAYASHAERATVHRRVLADYRGDWFTVPIAINNRGQIAGWAESEEGLRNAFFRTVGGRYVTIAESAEATDINDRGQVVGVRYPCPFCLPDEGFVWSLGGGFQSLGAFLPYAINAVGDMAGECAAERQACVLRDNVVVAIAASGSRALGINDRGDVAGFYFDDRGDLRAFHLTDDWEFRDLGPGVATDINNRRMIAGYLFADIGAGADRAVVTVWQNNRPRMPLRELSFGDAINKRGWVIVNAFDENGRSYSFLWNAPAGTGVLLATIDEEYTELEDINDRGQIVGTWGIHAAIWSVERK